MGAPTIVQTENGALSGTDGAVRVFKGIPYAAPPIGDLRWRAPQPPISWQGVRDATQFGADPIQAPNKTRAPGMSEDCLFLNVWTPAQNAAAKLPVIVWLSVGGFLSSSGAAAPVDGERLATKGAVVVTVNSRVGLFGYLGHPALRRESEGNVSGNYGLLDQIAALRWIQANIAAFGGDPQRVTVFGVSAGAASISLLMTSTLTKGLFQRAILSSPGAFRPLATLADAEELGVTLGTDMAALRQMPADAVFARTGDFVPKQRGLTSKRVLRPIHDGWLIPQDDRPAYNKGEIQAVQTILGNPIDEGGSFVGGWDVKTVPQFHALLAKEFSDWAEEARERYPVRTDADVGEQLALLFGDCQFTYGSYGVARALVTRQPATFRYLFTRHAGGGATAPRHGTETAYAFGNFPEAGDARGNFDELDREISNLVQDSWVRFAATGSPNGGEMPSWRAYARDNDPMMEFGDTLSVRNGWRQDQMRFLDRYYDAHPGG